MTQQAVVHAHKLKSCKKGAKRGGKGDVLVGEEGVKEGQEEGEKGGEEGG